MSTLSSQITEVFRSDTDRTVGDLIDSISTKSYGFMFLVLTVPSALPVPAPGYSTPFGIILTFLGIQYILGKDVPWFPNWLRNMKLKKNDGQGKLMKSVVSFISFFERFVKPRSILPVSARAKEIFFGLVITLCSISMILPIPLTNTGPSLGIFIMGIGFLQEDELFEFFGLLVGLAGIALSLSIIFFGVTAVEFAINQIRTLF